MSVDRVRERQEGSTGSLGAGRNQHVPASVWIISSKPSRAGSALFILMIMSSSICHYFSTFPFVKLIEQLNELKSFRRREKNTHPTIITVIKSGNYHLAFPPP